MTFEEWYADADELGFAPEIGTAAYLLLRDAWTVSARIERERCARVAEQLPWTGDEMNYCTRERIASAIRSGTAAGQWEPGEEYRTELGGES